MSFANASAQQYPFSPQVIPGLQLWLDGADRSSMFQNVAGTIRVTANGQTVNYWKDKSGNANNAIVNTAGGVTGATYASATNSLSFSGTNCYTTLYTASVSSETSFIVFNNPIFSVV